MRSAMWCGWLPRESWAASPDLPPMAIDGEVKTPPVCPGWLQRQPLVVDVAQAWRAFDKGCLGDVFPDAAAVVIEGIFLFDVAINRHHAEEDERRRREAHQNHGV